MFAILYEFINESPWTFIHGLEITPHQWSIIAQAFFRHISKQIIWTRELKEVVFDDFLISLIFILLK